MKLLLPGLSVAIAVLCGCSGIGQNSFFSVQYKKDIVNYYYDVHVEDRHLNGKQKANLKKEGPVYLSQQNILCTNIPMGLSGSYDSRAAVLRKKAIRTGEPVSLIINRVHIKDNGETAPWDMGEVGVIVTVDTGKQEIPNQTFVAYEEGIANKVDLPIADLLAYTNESYGDEPIRLEILVVDLDKIEGERFKKLLSTAATVGAATLPVYAPAFSVANEIGKLLIETKQDDVIVKFSFQLYPWLTGSYGSPSDSFGVPRLSKGSYLVVNSKPGSSIDPSSVHLGFDLKPYTLKNTHPCHSSQASKLRESVEVSAEAVAERIAEAALSASDKTSSQQAIERVSREIEENAAGVTTELGEVRSVIEGMKQALASAPDKSAADSTIRSQLAAVRAAAAERANKSGAMPVWPKLENVEPDKSGFEPLAESYLVVTVDNTPLKNAQLILQRMDAANKALSGVVKQGETGELGLRQLEDRFKDISSAYKRGIEERKFAANKRTGISAINDLFAAFDGLDNPNDKNAILGLIKRNLPLSGTDKDIADKAALKNWFDSNRASLRFLESFDKYCLDSVTCEKTPAEALGQQKAND